MKREILKRRGRQKPCQNCGETLKFSWLSGMNLPLVFFYSKEGSAIFVSNDLAKQLTNSASAVETTKVVDEFLFCKGLNQLGFDAKNGLKCPHCGIEVSPRSKDWRNDKAVFFDGMTYINDSQECVVQIET